METELIIGIIFMSAIVGIAFGYFFRKLKDKIFLLKALKRIKKQKLKGDGDFTKLLEDNTRLSEGVDLPKREEEFVKKSSDSPLPPLEEKKEEEDEK